MDDVKTLLTSSVEESYLFLVDSRNRDTAVFPTPSHYEYKFSTPFRNVVGLDLLDATVARTEYIVDSTTNRLDYVMARPASLAEWNQGGWPADKTTKRTLELDPGDYNIAQLIAHMNAKFSEKAALHGEAPIACAAASNPAEVSNRIVFSSAAPFTFLMTASTLRHTLGFGDPVTGASTDYDVVPGWSVNRTAGASDAFLSVSGILTNVDPAALTTGPLPAGTMTRYEAVYGAKAVRQYFESLGTGVITSVLTYVNATAGRPSLAVAVRRASDDALMASGTLVATVDDPNDVYVPLSTAMTPAAGAVAQAGEAYYVEFVPTTVTDPAEFVALYYNEDAGPVSAGRYITVDGAPAHEGSNLCVDVIAAPWGWTLATPGLVNLTGPRYVSIRCPEIESHMFRDRVNETCHAGLGMVQLRGYGFREQRFDFVSFPSRRFHPLGKLSKLTFRLERPDGSLYDSHGVDNSLLLVLRYRTLPSSNRPDASSDFSYTLNPGYSPDLHRYMTGTHWARQAAATDHTMKRY